MNYKYVLFIFVLFSPLYQIKVLSANELKGFHYSNEYNKPSDSVINTLTPFEDSINNSTGNITELVNQVKRERRFVNKLDKKAVLNLPIGLTDNPDDPRYMIALDAVSIHPDHATFRAYMSIENPINGNVLEFASNDIEFSFEHGITGPMEMILVSEEEFPLFNGSSLKVKSGTSATWDCNGFDKINLLADLSFDNSVFIPVDSKGEPTNMNMVVPMNTKIHSFSDFLFSFSLPRFKVKNFDEAIFSFDDVVLDMSESENPTGFAFPEGYPSDYSGDFFLLWKGLYIRTATVELAKLKRNDSQPVVFYAKEFIWDDKGISGRFGGENILPIDKGSLGGWPMALDKVEIEFVTGSFVSSSLEGRLVPQGFDPKAPLEYEASFDVKGNYKFGVSVGKKMEFNVFMADINLEPNSMIGITIDNGQLKPYTKFYGDIQFGCPIGGDKKLSTPKFKFEELRIATFGERFDLKHIDLNSLETPKLDKFPLTLNEFKFTKTNGKAKLSFNAIVNLKKDSEEGFGGETNLSLIGNVGENSTWGFDKVEINSIHVDVAKPGAYTISGDVNFIRGDAVYGSGFSGSLDALFGKDIQVKASAFFGSVNGYRYFYVDALAALNPGIQAGPITFNGFGGGLSYKMLRTSDGTGIPDFAKSTSGFFYKPDASKGIGILAMVKMCIGRKELIDAEVKYQIAFNSGGGIDRVEFLGEAVLLDVGTVLPVDKIKDAASLLANGKEIPAKSNPIRAKMGLLLDFENDVFHAYNEIYMNIYGVLKGIGANDRAGYMVLHVEDSEWYLHIGTPSDPIGLNFLGMAETKSYFMAGHNIPDAMPMHPKVLEILGMSNSDFEGDRGGEIISGNGLAFGTAFDISTGDLTFLAFYANFELGFGFDIMLLRYPNGTTCEGLNGDLGINNWYAKGQAYVYFSGKIGIKVNLFLKTKKFEILSLQCAAAMRAEGPNPFWAIGAVGGEFSVLGGMIKGNCSFKVEVGEKCNMKMQSAADQLANLEIIGDIAPEDKAEDVNIFSMPQVVFNMPVGKEVKISEDENTNRYFRIKLNKCKLYEINGGNKTEYPANFEWNSDNSVLALAPNTIFYPTRTYKIEVETAFEERVGGTWELFKDESDNVLVEAKTAQFETGALPDAIPDNYIAYSYPLNKMVNYYAGEYNKGYVTFIADIAPFFALDNEWTQKVRFTDLSNNSQDLALSYTASTKSVDFNMPALKKEEIYTMQLVHVPVNKNMKIDRNVVSTESEIANSGSTNATITTNEAEGVISDAEDKAFYTIHFRSSKFNTMAEKIGINNTIKVRFLYYVSGGIDFLGATIYPGEMFDKYEISGDGNLSPLMQRSAKMDGADWYAANMFPKIYDNYPIYPGMEIKNRTVSVVGVPPVKDIRIWQIDYDRVLSDTEIESGVFNDKSNKAHIVYTMPYYWANDYSNTYNSLYNYRANGNSISTRALNILNNPIWPLPSRGDYPIEFKYVLPGRNIVTSTKRIVFQHPFDIAQPNFDVESGTF